jgi:hypothetical protein
MGRSYEKSNSSGSLDRTNEVTTHRQFRVTSCIDNQKVSKVTSKETISNEFLAFEYMESENRDSFLMDSNFREDVIVSAS